MKKMRLILSLFIFLFISASAIAQSNERKVIPTEGGKLAECSHGDGHWTFIPDEVNVEPGVYASPTGGCPYRPYREMVAYDETLLNTYSKDSLETWIRRAYDRFERAMNNSGLTHGGVRLIKIMPVKVEQSYTTLGKLSSYVKNLSDGVMDSLPIIKNELLDCDHLTIITREGISTSELGLNTQVVVKDPVLYFNTTWKTNLGAVNLITIAPNALITFAHECGHGVGADHENPFASSITPTYARSYVDPVKQVSDIMKSGTIASWVVEVFSGPNSKTVKNGETLTIGNDTINNARHVQEVLDMVMCATENHVTRVSLSATTCGSGKLKAISNNADTFQWKVLSGDCSITGTGQEISYMAMSLSKVQVIAQKKGKWYWDTAVVEIPALQIFPQAMEKCQGTNVVLPNGNNYMVTKDTTMEFMLQGQFCDSMVILSLKALPTSSSSQQATIKSGQSYTLPDGKVVNTSGTYVSTLKNSFGCDSIITTVLTVTTATVDPKVLGLSIYPNPTQEILVIDGLLSNDQISVHDVLGKKLSTILNENKVSLCNMPTGIYILTIQRGEDRVVMKVLKL